MTHSNLIPELTLPGREERIAQKTGNSSYQLRTDIHLNPKQPYPETGLNSPSKYSKTHLV